MSSAGQLAAPPGSAPARSVGFAHLNSGAATGEGGLNKAIAFQLDGDGDELEEAHYDIGKRLGRGSFATVYLARHTVTDKKVVIKKLDRIEAQQEEQVRNEVELMKHASGHPNLVAYKGYYRTQENVMCIVMGYCEGGTLAELLKAVDSGTYFAEEQVMDWFIQLTLATAHLHDMNVIHRDLKPGNIFLNKMHTIVKVGDLGIAKRSIDPFELNTTMMGTPYYMSPELMANRPYTNKADIWSLGCILYEMAARRTAFEAKGMPQLMVKIMRNAYQPLPSHFSRQFSQLVGSMLRSDPDERPAAIQLLQLPYVRGHAERLVAQGLSPQIDSLLTELLELPADLSVMRLERPMTAVSTRTTATRPKTGKNKKKGNKKLGKTQYLQTIKVAPTNVNQWDAGAAYEQQQLQQRERRHQAREMELRLGREVARQHRKATDPRERAKEERKQRQLRAVMKERQRRKIAEEEAAILRAKIGEDAAMEGPDVAFRTYNKLGRTVPGMPGEEEDEAEEAGLEDRVSWHKQQAESFSAKKAGSSEAAYLSQFASVRSLQAMPSDVSQTGASLAVNSILDGAGDVGLEEEMAAAGVGSLEGYMSEEGGEEDEDDEDDEEDEDGDDEGVAEGEGDREEVEAEGKEGAEEQEGQQVMEDELAAVWESDPIKRMELLERMWQQSLCGNKGWGSARAATVSKHANRREAVATDPNKILTSLMSPREPALADGGLVSPTSGRQILPPLTDAPRRARTSPAGDSGASAGPYGRERQLSDTPSSSRGGSAIEGLRSSSDTHGALERPKTGPKLVSMGQGAGYMANRQNVLFRDKQHSSGGEVRKPMQADSRRGSVGGAGFAVAGSRGHMGQPAHPVVSNFGEDDPLLAAVKLRRILTHKSDAESVASASSRSTPSPMFRHSNGPLAPLKGKDGRRRSHELDTPAHQPQHVRFKASPDGSSDSSPMGQSHRRSQPSGPKGGLPQIASSLEDGKRRNYTHHKDIAEDFYKVMAVNSVRNLQADALLSADENPAVLHDRMLDPQLPDRMMALQRRNGGEEAHLPWEKGAKGGTDKEEGGKETGRAVSFYIPNAPGTGENPLPRLQAEREAAAASRTAAGSPSVQQEPPGSPTRVEEEHHAMFSAVRNQMAEVKRWRETLVSGRKSHENAAVELMDHAATISSNGRRKSLERLVNPSGNEQRAAVESADANTEAETESDSDDEVINL